MTVTVTLNPTGDTQINSSASGFNYGTGTTLQVGESNAGSGSIRSLLKFDLSTIPADAIVLSAKLRMYLITDLSSAASDFRVYRTFRDWVELQANWTQWKNSNNWATAGGFNASDTEQTDIGSISMTTTETINSWKEWDLHLQDIQDMISGAFADNGFMIKATVEANDAYVFNSSEAASNLPELVIEYTMGSINYLKNRGHSRLDLSGISAG